ncbi:MAG TPA: hypothetical protein VKF41_03575 [Bryobacteraceae bacterium]|nr:hypothetical protein [Bryobacteraceae bacterium]
MVDTRPFYQPGGLIAARDLNDEQAYRLAHLRRHARFLHGSGVVCGFKLVAAPQRQAPWTVRVCPGYTLGPCGDEIEVPASVLVDIRRFFWSRPYSSGVGARTAFVGLRARIDDACGCKACGQDPSPRIVDEYVIEILWKIESVTQTVDLCHATTAPCPPVPNGPHVVLGAVRLPASESIPLTDADLLI